MNANCPVVLAIAVYADLQRTRADFAAAWAARPLATSGHLAVAELGRDLEGSLRVRRHKSTATNVAWGGALLGAALVLVVPQAGARFLASVPSVGGAGAVAGHLQRTISRNERDVATDLLERSRAGVVVLAVNLRPCDIEPLLAGADESFAMVSVWDGLDRAIEQEIAESQANPSGT